MKLGAAPPADVVRPWRCVPVLKTDAGACPVGTPDCCCERVSQDLDLVSGLRGRRALIPVSGTVQEVTVKSFRTFWRQRQKMAAWLAGLGGTDTAMESTGVFWWPVYHALSQAGIGVCVCNAAHMRTTCRA